MSGIIHMVAVVIGYATLVILAALAAITLGYTGAAAFSLTLLQSRVIYRKQGRLLHLPWFPVRWFGTWYDFMREGIPDVRSCPEYTWRGVLDYEIKTEKKN